MILYVILCLKHIMNHIGYHIWFPVVGDSPVYLHFSSASQLPFPHHPPWLPQHLVHIPHHQKTKALQSLLRDLHYCYPWRTRQELHTGAAPSLIGAIYEGWHCLSSHTQELTLGTWSLLFIGFNPFHTWKWILTGSWTKQWQTYYFSVPDYIWAVYELFWTRNYIYLVTWFSEPHVSAACPLSSNILN